MQEEAIIRDGFLVLKTTFNCPDDVSQLAAAAKRQATICNLFVNHLLPIQDVARILDDSYIHVVMVLIEQGILQDRRTVSRKVSDLSERSSPSFRKRFERSPNPQRRWNAG